MSSLNDLNGVFLGRVWNPQVQGPSVVTLRKGRLIDITSRQAPLVRDICEMDDPAGYVQQASGADLTSIAEVDEATSADQSRLHWLAPCDLQAVKACGVTFAGSMLERVIEERAEGNPALAQSIRSRISALVGASLRNIKPGSPQAAEVKRALQAEGMWSQYLEVGIGPDAEVFSKAQMLSAVGFGAKVGLHPISVWNNPEPEMVLAVSSAGRIVGACLGNDVNLRDVEGRSALLLSKAKDNNASCSIGPMIRLFTADFTLDAVRKAELRLTVKGLDGYVLHGQSRMTEISRDPEDLVRQTIGAHHQYPDGLMLFLGTLFAPTEDRDAPGQGFTHHLGDSVEISSPDFGMLRNEVQLSTECPRWEFGVRALMANLAGRGMLGVD